jgi:benzoylsuccinyl-CoA thiolase BbsA subunit
MGQGKGKGPGYPNSCSAPPFSRRVILPECEGKRKFVEEGWFRDFGEGLALKGGRCRNCGKICFPMKPVCPTCFGSEQEEIPLNKRGKLHTFALSHMGPPGMETPYVIGFVDLPEGIKLFSPLTQCEPWDEVLKVEMEMEMVVETIRRDAEGTEIIGYKFRPVLERRS